MAHSVEGRYPFLDREVQELLAKVPPALKIHVAGVQAREKYLLRRAMSGSLPREVLTRRKKPFLAPFGTPFVRPDAPEYVGELLSDRMIGKFGYFDPVKVGAVLGRLAALSESARGPATPGLSRTAISRTVDGMALTFVLSVQLLEHIVRSTGYRYYPADLAGVGRPSLDG